MKYKCADDIYKVLHERLNATTLTGEEASLWFKNDPETQEAIKFLRLFSDAIDNPPDGVVGVGRITYAEGVLQAAQRG